MGAGRVGSTVVKVIAFLAFMAVAVFLFRKDSLKSLSNRWAMRGCPDVVQADLTLMLALQQPKVVSCEGTPAQATCIVETTEKAGRKTAPVKNWDCTRRHLTPDAMEDIRHRGLPAQGRDVRAGRECGHGADAGGPAGAVRIGEVRIGAAARANRAPGSGVSRCGHTPAWIVGVSC